MAKKRDTKKQVKPVSFEDRLRAITENKGYITQQEYALLDEALTGNNPQNIIKAQNYINRVNGSGGKSNTLLFMPEGESMDLNGYKRAIKPVTFDVLRNIGKTPFVFGVISTRIEQMINFAKFTTDFDKEGWTIRKKIGRFDDHKEYKNSDSDKKVIDKIATFLENGGENAKFSIHSDFKDFISMLARDSLELDQACFEVRRNKGNDLHSYTNVDSGLFRLLETIDPNFVNTQFEPAVFKGAEYLPYYAQVWRQNIVTNPLTQEKAIYYPWELGFGTRNKTSNVFQNGYGTSELEILIEIITWILWGMQYNGNFFKQGSNPRGFFTIKDQADPRTLQRFRMNWRNTMAGVENSHKTPIFDGSDVNWVDMQTSNKDMEFGNWNEFLILCLCMVYRIAPEELNFSFKNQAQIFGQDGQKERLNHSKEKGLKPLLVHMQKWINKWLVSEMDENYEFVWTGVDLEDITEQIDRDKKLSEAGFVSQQDMFKKYSGRDFNPEKDVILNSVYTQQKQMDMYGGGVAEGDQYDAAQEDANPFAEESSFDKSIRETVGESNPMSSTLNNWIETTLKK